MTDTGTTAVVGVAGGAGATRLSVEAAATIARTDRPVAVVDAALGTQGLADYLPDRADADVTRALLEPDVGLDACAVDPDWPVEGRVVLCPARAPFERLARAQTAGAARAFGDLLADAAARYDVVLVDAPPVATNVAVAAVTEAERVALVAPPGGRGTTALQRVRDRLADVGTAEDAVVVDAGVDPAAADAAGAVGDAGAGGSVDADAVVPGSGVREPSAAPACVDPDAEFAPAVARAAEAMVGEPLSVEFDEAGLLDGIL